MEKARVLIVEDEELVALDIQTYLGEIGHIDTRIATTGEEAIAAVTQFAPDLILMDISLAGEMSGIEAAKTITSSFHVPIVYLTAHSDVKTIEEAKVAQPYGYIVKPFDERNLLATIEMALYKSSNLDELSRTDERLKSILKSMGEGIIVTGPTGMVDFMDSNAMAILGMKSPRTTPMSILSAFSVVSIATGARIPLNLSGALLDGKRVSIRDCRIIAMDKREFPAEVDVAPLHSERGSVMGIVVSIRDMGQRTVVSA